MNRGIVFIPAAKFICSVADDLKEDIDALRKVMRVDHAFDAESDSEMSIVPGELLVVLEEVDAGWFIGEIVGEEQRSGMFPATYCTVVETPQQNTRRTPLKPSSPTKSEEGDVFGDTNDPVASLSQRRTTGRIATPPRSKSAGPAQSVAPTVPAKKKPPPPPPMARGTKPASSATTTVASDSKCRECGCTEFRANVFKRGSCNNCFHVHVPF